MAETTLHWNESLLGGWPGISAFVRVDSEAYHTIFGRGVGWLP